MSGIELAFGIERAVDKSSEATKVVGIRGLNGATTEAQWRISRMLNRFPHVIDERDDCTEIIFADFCEYDDEPQTTRNQVLGLVKYAVRRITEEPVSIQRGTVEITDVGLSIFEHLDAA